MITRERGTEGRRDGGTEGGARAGRERGRTERGTRDKPQRLVRGDKKLTGWGHRKKQTAQEQQAANKTQDTRHKTQHRKGQRTTLEGTNHQLRDVDMHTRRDTR